MFLNIVKQKAEHIAQAGIKRSKKKPLRITKMVTVEDGPPICEKRWKQTAICDPDNTRQTSNGSPPRRIKDSAYITDLEHLKKNLGEKDSYEQRKENKSRKQCSLRSKAKERNDQSDRGSSAISNMSRRKSTSTMEQMKFLCVPNQLALI